MKGTENELFRNSVRAALPAAATLASKKEEEYIFRGKNRVTFILLSPLYANLEPVEKPYENEKRNDEST